MLKNNSGLFWDINDLARVFIETVKDIRSCGQEVSTDNISDKLSKRDDITTLLEIVNKSDSKDSRSLIESEKKIMKEKLAASDEERSKLFRKVLEAEKALEYERDFQKQLAITFINMVKPGENDQVQEQLSEIKRLLMSNSELEIRETALRNLKNQLIKVELGEKGNDKKKKSSQTLLKSILNLTDRSFIDQIKTAALEGLFTLRGMLGEEFTQILSDVENRINNSNDLEYLLSQRAIVLEIIEDYAEQIEKEKEKITIFVKEIGKKLSDLEKNLLDSAEADAKMREEDFSFSQNIETEIKNVSESVKGSENFDNLKTAVISRLERISSALSNKRKEYIVLLERSGRERSKISKNFKDMIIELKEQNKILSEQIRKDPLTGIFNRRVFDEKLTLELDRYRRYKKNFSLIFFDVDFFKNINDRYGHQAGDRALSGIASRAQDGLRKTDVLARFGGEEFVAVLPETPLSQGIKAAQKIHKLINDTAFEYEGESVPITVSIGVTEASETDENIETIIARADSLMYEAKKRGRNRIVSDSDIIY